MSKERILSVIIPYYQRDTGILDRALKSVLAQEIPSGWQIEVIVVDDGSPRPAKDETAELTFTSPLQLTVIEQNNGGVAVARNRGLDAVNSKSEIIAFLDSDDIWPKNHISTAIDAFDLGYDFVFSDNKRAPHHNSYLAACAPMTLAAIQKSTQENGFYGLPQSEMAKLVSEEFPTQASTVLFRRAVAQDLRYNLKLKACGEDVVFMVSLACRANRICFNSHGSIECGHGVNIYFGQFEWDSPKFMSIRRDQISCHELVAQIPNLPNSALIYNSRRLKKSKRDFAFHTLRLIIKNKGRVPPEVSDLIHSSKGFIFWFPISILYILMGRIFGFYKP